MLQEFINKTTDESVHLNKKLVYLFWFDYSCQLIMKGEMLYFVYLNQCVYIFDQDNIIKKYI